MAKTEMTPEQAVALTHKIDYSVPHVTAQQPLHMRQGIATGQTHILDSSGRPITGKNHDDRFNAYQSEIMNPKGDPMRIVPVYSDRLATGSVKLPYSQKEFAVHGGNGFGSHPERYGSMAWAVGHDPKRGYGAMSNTGAEWARHVSEDAKGPGVIGAVWLGSHDAHLGNVTLFHALAHELEYLRQNDPVHYASVNEGFRKIPQFYSSEKVKTHLGHPVNKWPHLEAFLHHYSGEHSSMGSRYEIMADLLKKQIANPADLGGRKSRNVDADGFAFTTFLRRVNSALTDHEHVPGGHVVSLVRFHGEGPFFHGTTHPAYKWMLPGSYLGELQQTVPLANLFPQMRLAPPEGKPPLTGLFIMHNPYHPRVKADPNAFMQEGIMNKALRVGRSVVSELDPDAVNLYLYKKSLNPEVQKRAVYSLMRALKED